MSKLWELVMDKEAWRAASMGLQRVRHDWVTELNRTPLLYNEAVTFHHKSKFLMKHLKFYF